MRKYRIKISIAEFLKYQAIFETRKIEHNDDYLKIEINHIIYEKLNTLDVKYELIKDYQKDLFTKLSLKRGFIVGLFIIISFLILNNFRVKEITFNNDFLINEQIKARISEKSVRFLGQTFITDNVLKELNQKILEDFVSYEYISLKREGTSIQVVINKEELKSFQKEFAKEGDLIATKNGVVKYFNIYDGKSLVYLNKTVNRGDLLASSNMLYGLDLKMEELVSARGFVICETLDYIDVLIEKNQVEEIYTNKTQEKNCINFFNKSTCKAKTSFTDYDYEEETVFNLFNMFKINKVKYKEKQKNFVEINKKQADLLAQKIINDEFEIKKTIEYEKIVNINQITCVDSEKYYEFRYLVKKLENIALFKANN